MWDQVYFLSKSLHKIADGSVLEPTDKMEGGNETTDETTRVRHSGLLAISMRNYAVVT